MFHQAIACLYAITKTLWSWTVAGQNHGTLRSGWLKPRTPGCRIVYNHYVTDDVINGKLVTGYFESLKEL